MNARRWVVISTVFLAAAANATPRWQQHRDDVARSAYAAAPVPKLLTALTETRGGPEAQVMLQALALRKAEALPSVKERLRTGPMFEKFMVTKFLRYCPWPETMPELVALARDKTQHWLPRQGALYALGALGDKAAGRDVAEVLREPDCPHGVQLVAIAALARMNYREGKDVVRAFAQHKDIHARLFVARALAEFGEAVDQGFVTASLQSKDYIVRQEACELLAFAPDATAPLEQMSRTDPHEAVRDTAGRALLERKLRGQQATAKTAILREALPQAQPRTVAWIIRTMLEQGGKEGRALVEELAERNDHVGERSRVGLVLAGGR